MTTPERPKFKQGEGTIEEVLTKAGVRYRARVPMGAPGKRQNGPLVESRDEANEWRIELLTRFAGGEVKPAEALTLREFFVGRFLPKLVAIQKPCAAHYQQAWNKWLSTSKLADRSIVELSMNRRLVREYLEGLVGANVKAPDGQSVHRIAKNSVHGIRTALSAAFTAAVKAELVIANPVRGIELAFNVHDEDAFDIGENFLQPEEQQALLSCREIPLADRLVIAFDMFQGLRAGELVHMPLADLERAVSTGKLLVRYGSRKAGKLCKPKGNKTRLIPLLAPAREAAAAWLEQLPRLCPSNPLKLAFPTENGCRRPKSAPLGEAYDGEKRHHVWEDHLDTAEIEVGDRDLSWHALRHTTGASLVSAWWGAPWEMKRVSTFLGHSTIVVTEKYYGHLHSSALDETAAGVPALGWTSGQRRPAARLPAGEIPAVTPPSAPPAPRAASSSRSRLTALIPGASEPAPGQWPGVGLLELRAALVERLRADDLPSEAEAADVARRVARAREGALLGADPVMVAAARLEAGGPHYVLRLLELLDLVPVEAPSPAVRKVP